VLGRFAPSPTGPLHMGSLVTALASYLDVKQRDGQWHVRVDDLDPPREQPGAKAQILASLDAHGLKSDGPIDWQSQHQEAYRSAIESLQTASFYCVCSRRSLAAYPVYPGTCRGRNEPCEDTATRLRVEGDEISFVDRVLGPQSCDIEAEFGDFIIQRRDGLVAYNLATAVDDGSSAVTTVLRGQDVLHVTGPQIYLMNRLKFTPPEYAHIPVLTYDDGTKLSKQTGAPAIDDAIAASNLRSALYYLGFAPPPDDNTVAEWIAWGLERWSLDRVPRALPTYGAEPR
jgi:glutamyl-Q tRNA(Asp) synthetase